MTSKSLYFKLMREDLKSRIWAVALIALGGFFLYPVAVAFLAGGMKDAVNYERELARYAREMKTYLSFENGLAVFMSMVSSVVCGFSGFTYLNSRKKVDFYHSIPVRRETLFLVNYFDGILIMAVPFAVNLAAGTVIAAANGVDGGTLIGPVVSGFAFHMVYFVLMYTVTVLAAMLTGNLVIGFLGNIVLGFYLPAVMRLFRAYEDVFFETYLYQDGGLAGTLMTWSPYVQYILRMNDYQAGRPILSAVLTALLVSAALAVICCLLYKKRPSEAAGKAMAFRVSRPVIRILITMLASLGFALFFWGVRESNGWAVFGVICGAVICHCVIEIIYHFDFKKLFSHKLQLAGCILAGLGIFLVFRYDLTGFDSYLPDAGQVKEVWLKDNRLTEWVSYGRSEWSENEDGGEYRWVYDDSHVEESLKLPDIEAVLDIASEGISQTKAWKTAKNAGNLAPASEETIETEIGTAAVYAEMADRGITELESGFDEETSVRIGYTLKSGRKVYRIYRMKLGNVRKQMEAIYGSSEFQKANYPLMNRNADEVASIRYRENGEEVVLPELTANQKEELLESYQREFAAMTLSRMEKEYPMGLIRFTTLEDETAMRWWKEHIRKNPDDYRNYRYDNEFARRDFYPIYPSFTETLALLSEYGVQPGSYANELNVLSVETVVKDPLGRRASGIIFRDPEEIREIMTYAVDDAIAYYDPMFLFDDIHIEVFFKEENPEYGPYNSTLMYLPKGEVPELIKERLAEQGGK